MVDPNRGRAYRESGLFEAHIWVGFPTEMEHTDFDNIPLLPLRDMVLFPGVTSPISIGREASLALINQAYRNKQTICTVTQRVADVEKPYLSDMFSVGVTANIIKVLELPDGTTSAILQVKELVHLDDIVATEPFLRAKVSKINEVIPVDSDKEMAAVIIAAIILLTVVLTILLTVAVRRIPVQYAKRVVGRKMYGGQSTHIPMKVNAAGVIPIIFSISLLQFPLTITYFFPNSGFTDFVTKYLSPSGNPGVWVYAGLNIVLTMFFTYFYTAIMFNPTDVADNMRQNGGFIPGIRPGVATVEYLSKIMSRLCFAGGLFLAAVATIPTIVSVFTPFNFSFGGTSLLILVGVALDIVQQLENQMLMRNYQGFLK